MILEELNISLDDAVTKSPELQQEVQKNPVARSIVDQGRIIEGMVRNTGKACLRRNHRGSGYQQPCPGHPARRRPHNTVPQRSL